MTFSNHIQIVGDVYHTINLAAQAEAFIETENMEIEMNSSQHHKCK